LRTTKTAWGSIVACALVAAGCTSRVEAPVSNAVLFEGSSCGEDVRPPAARSGKTEVPMVPVFSLGNLDTPSCLRGYRTRSAFGPDRDRPLLQVPPGAELLDEFESEHEYSRQSWGLGSLGV